MHRDVNLIVLHCSATPDGKSLFTGTAGEPGFRTPVQEIDGWHKARGFSRGMPWRLAQNRDLEAIGYHWVIYTNGAIATGRHLDEIGAHTNGHNRRSVGVCMIGTERFTADQWASLKFLVEAMKLKYQDARVCGHRDLSPDANNDGVIQPQEWLKTCPGFDVAAWRNAGMQPAPEHVLPVPAKAPA